MLSKAKSDGGGEPRRGIGVNARHRAASMLVALVAAVAWPLLTAGSPLPAAHDFVSTPARVDRCADSQDVAIFTSPALPSPGQPLRLLVVAQEPFDATLAVDGPTGRRVVSTRQRHGASPYWWTGAIAEPAKGHYRVTLWRGEALAACEVVEVAGGGTVARGASGSYWPVEREWTRATENLYSAWVEKLFDDPLDAEPSWKSLHEVTREPARNFLYDHLGLGEDSASGLVLEPDCADLPYFLRGYFAWKLGLPFAYSSCHAQVKGGVPTCGERHSNLEPPTVGKDTLSRMQRFFSRDVGWTVHSATGRTAPEDSQTDLYPTRLTVDGLRPGTVYADPYGHVLIVVKRVPQTATSSGILLAVDAQPDGTVARKQYWRGNFLFSADPALGGPGFKHFRPLVFEGRGVRPLGNSEIRTHSAYGNYSLEQYAHGAEGFYDRVDEVLSPEPRAVEQVFREVIDALERQVRSRITSVANGEEYMAAKPAVIAMPEGAAIFQTVGPWEDYSTPARDLRLLIAIDVVRGFPAEVERRPRRFLLPRGKAPSAVRRELEALLVAEAKARTIEYTRSDGSTWTLTLADVITRAEALEMAYNPNDCVEERWGAPDGSRERATCRRHAPADQKRRMAEAREWFSGRKRPST